MRTPVLLACLALLAGCQAPPTSDLAGAELVPGSDVDGRAGCGVAFDGKELDFCGVVLQVHNATFTVVDFNRTERVAWSDLRLEAANASLVVDSVLHGIGDGVDLGTILPGNVRKEQSFGVCTHGAPSVVVRLRDVRPVGAQAALNLTAPGCGAPAALEETYRVTLTNARAQGATFQSGTGCVYIPEQPTPWRGWAEARWEATTPLAERLHLELAGAGGEGTSPLRVELTRASASETWAYVYAAQGSVALEQAVDVTIHIEAIGELEGPRPC